MPHTLRLEECTPDVKLSAGEWWYVRATDTGVDLAIENPRIEREWDEDGPHAVTAHDRLMILDVDTWRECDDGESDEYTDDVRDYLRASDWD